MSRSSLQVTTLALCAGALLAGCSGRKPPTTVPAGETMGVYRGRLDESGGKSRRFRLLLYVVTPDRLHGEVLSPVGTTEMIVDGGAGRLAVTLVRDGVSYVGDASAEILERVLGVRLGLEELVGGILTGDLEHEAIAMTRTASAGDGLPDHIEFRSDEATLSLELKRLRPVKASTDVLGTGEPPGGTERRALDELGQEHRVGEPVAPGAPS